MVKPDDHVKVTQTLEAYECSSMLNTL